MDSILPIVALTATAIFAFSSIYGKIIITKLASSYYFLLLQIVFTGLLLLFINVLFIKPNISVVFNTEKGVEVLKGKIIDIIDNDIILQDNNTEIKISYDSVINANLDY